VIFSILISFKKFVQKLDCYCVFMQVFTARMPRKSDKILMSLNNKQKLLCQLATIELYPRETKKKETARKLPKRIWD